MCDVPVFSLTVIHASEVMAGIRTLLVVGVVLFGSISGKQTSLVIAHVCGAA